MSVIEDWQDGSAYPHAGQDTLLSRWHWEFLRRNSLYQKDYELFRSLPDDSAGRQKKYTLARKYGLDGIMFDYMDSMEELFKSPRDPEKVRIVLWRTEWVKDDVGNIVEGHMEDFDYLDPKLRQHECTIVFNLRNPADKQIDKAKELLLKELQRFEEKRGRIENYPLYLRLIDADDAKASFDEIAKVMFPDVEIRIARKKIDEELKNAIKIRDVNYRYL
jgi:hypothetical protein